MREINQAGLNLIKKYEGCSLKAYVCPAGVLTIGYGHTGLDVGKNQVITQFKADELLKNDLLKFCKTVDARVKVPLNDNQFAALVSFTFNVGSTNLFFSTLLKQVNRGNVPQAAEQFLKWNKAGGKVLDGLTKRRQAEKELWLAQ